MGNEQQSGFAAIDKDKPMLEACIRLQPLHKEMIDGHISKEQYEATKEKIFEECGLNQTPAAVAEAWTP